MIWASAILPNCSKYSLNWPARAITGLIDESGGGPSLQVGPRLSWRGMHTGICLLTLQQKSTLTPPPCLCWSKKTASAMCCSPALLQSQKRKGGQSLRGSAGFSAHHHGCGVRKWHLVSLASPVGSKQNVGRTQGSPSMVSGASPPTKIFLPFGFCSWGTECFASICTSRDQFQGTSFRNSCTLHDCLPSTPGLLTCIISTQDMWFEVPFQCKAPPPPRGFTPLLVFGVVRQDIVGNCLQTCLSMVDLLEFRQES